MVSFYTRHSLNAALTGHHMLKRVHFPSSPLPYMLVAPQLAITLVFFIWPASQAMYQSLLIEDAFGLGWRMGYAAIASRFDRVIVTRFSVLCRCWKCSACV
jgi:hypothetical protein